MIIPGEKGFNVTDLMGNQYLFCHSFDAGIEVYPTHLTNIQDPFYGRPFLMHLCELGSLGGALRDLYLYARPDTYLLHKKSDWEVLAQLVQMLETEELRVWQTRDYLREHVAALQAKSSSVESDSTTSTPPSKPVIRRRQTEETAESQASVEPTASIHEPATPAPTVPKSRDLNDPLQRKALFDQHGVIVGPYKELQQISMTGYQREHFIPHSCYMARSSLPNEKRANVPIGSEFGSYNEGDAITYFVYDDQSKGTEHRYLTDVEKKYAKDLQCQGEFASSNEWLDHMESETAKSLSMDTIERSPGVYEPRIPPEDAADVAKAIRIEYEDSLDEMGVNKTAKLSNLVGGGSVPGTELTDGKDDF